MSTEVEFGEGNKDVADAVRDEYEEYLCSDDDRRLRTVIFSSDTPDDVLDRVTVRAARTRSERDGAGQRPLTDAERNRIDFSKPRASVPHARAVKAIATEEGVDDWVAYYDGTLTVDEHRDVMAEAARDERGQRMDSQDTTDDRLGRAEKALGEECDHARDHCEMGDPDACEFLADQCDLSDDAITQLRETASAGTDLKSGDPDESELTGKQAGAIQRSIGAMAGAVDEAERGLDKLREAWDNAQQAAKAVNSIRESVGYEPQHFDRIEAFQADLLDFMRMVDAECNECHADHAGHDHDVTTGDREDVREFVDRGRSATPVGSGGDRGDDPTDAADDLETVAEGDRFRDTLNDEIHVVESVDRDVATISPADGGGAWNETVGTIRQKLRTGEYAPPEEV